MIIGMFLYVCMWLCSDVMFVFVFSSVCVVKWLSVMISFGFMSVIWCCRYGL